jgi:hypothetical protein
MRKVHLILTIGGGFLGVVITLEAFVTAGWSISIPNALLIVVFVALYGYGLFAGLRFADHPEDKKHLALFYWLQVPWVSSPFIAYRFTSGFHVSGAFMDSKLSGAFRLGSDWQFSLFNHAPWGIGVNVFALVMVILLMKKNQNQEIASAPASALASAADAAAQEPPQP